MAFASPRREQKGDKLFTVCRETSRHAWSGQCRYWNSSIGRDRQIASPPAWSGLGGPLSRIAIVDRLPAPRGADPFTVTPWRHCGSQGIAASTNPSHCSGSDAWVRTTVARWTFRRLTLSFLAACLWETAPHFKAPIGALKLSPFRSPPCFIVAILAATIDRWLSSKRRGARTTADIKMGARAIFRLRAQPSSLSGSGSLKVCACRGCLILRPRSS